MANRFVKLIIAILLIPLCYSITLTLLGTLQQLWIIHPRFGTHFWWLSGGFVFWIILYFCSPRPALTYVLGHELTHMIWAWLLGARTTNLKVSSKGGSVCVTKSNFLITLAPYFFPFYTICTLLIYGILSIFCDQSVYEPFWLACIGLTWGFHITFTLSMLKIHQPDIREHGQIFSYVIIYFMNILGIGLWVVIIGTPEIQEFLVRLIQDTVYSYNFCKMWINNLFNIIYIHQQ